MNQSFAAYATGTAFRIDLTRRMIGALFRAARGDDRITTGHYGARGLLDRGLVEICERQEGEYYKRLRITEAGRKVVELCEMAGLGNPADDPSEKEGA